jgi:hypothetical protein
VFSKSPLYGVCDSLFLEVPSNQNVFDSELAAWNDMAVEATAIVSAATENTGQQPQCRSGSKGLEDNLRKQPPGKYG